MKDHQSQLPRFLLTQDGFVDVLKTLTAAIGVVDGRGSAPDIRELIKCLELMKAAIK